MNKGSHLPLPVTTEEITPEWLTAALRVDLDEAGRGGAAFPEW